MGQALWRQTSQRKLFGKAPSNNLNYVVLERDRPLRQADRRYYDRLVTALRADTEHVYSITDLWSDPITQSAAQSRDGRAADLMLRLSGMLGTSQASDAVAVVRDTADRLGPPPGLHVYMTGPGGTLTERIRRNRPPDSGSRCSRWSAARC